MNISYAVLSDIHSNHYALETCIRYAMDRGVTKFLLLGDYVGELAYPQKTMKLLYELKEKYACTFIRGNREEYMLNHEKNDDGTWIKGNSISGALLYGYENLKKQDRDFFRGLPICKRIEVEGFPAFTIGHGSPFRSNQRLAPGENAATEIVKNVDTSLILCGHTHVQCKFEVGNTSILNPGAVGYAQYSNGKAQFMILHGREGRWEEEFISLEYEVEKTIQEIWDSGLAEYAPGWSIASAELLRYGLKNPGDVLNRAMEMCKERKMEVQWPFIPETIWKIAMKEVLNL